VLTEAQLARRRGRRRATASPQQLYQEFLVHRIEAHKNSISRQDLMKLAGEALADQNTSTEGEGQLLLTEVMMLDCVDRLIIKRLRLPTFKTWKQRYGKLRATQREPAYWGVSEDHAVTRLLPRCEAGDRALLVGAAAEPLAPLLAAYDVEVTFLAGSLTLIERLERRVAEESLAGLLEAFVVQLGRPWLPPAEAPTQLVVIDTGEVGSLAEAEQRTLISALQQRLGPIGAHVLLGHAGRVGTISAWYAEWRRADQKSAGRDGATLFPPTCLDDDNLNESLQHTILDGRD
jgi:hypothetical protein